MPRRTVRIDLLYPDNFSNTFYSPFFFSYSAFLTLLFFVRIHMFYYIRYLFLFLHFYRKSTADAHKNSGKLEPKSFIKRKIRMNVRFN